MSFEQGGRDVVLPKQQYLTTHKTQLIMIQLKQCFISLIFAFCSFNSISQVSIKATKLTNIDANFLYIGVDNVLKVEGFANLPVQLISKKSSVKQISDNEFIVHVSSLGMDTITVLKSGKEIFNKVFEVSRITDPVARIGKSKSNGATVAEILIDPTLNVFLPNCYIFSPFTVSNFSGTFISQNGNSVTTFSSTTNKFSNDQIKIIEKLKSGDKIHIDKIVVGGPDSIQRMMQIPLTVNIQ